MKRLTRYLHLLLFITFVSTVNGQNIPTTPSLPTASPVTPPSAYTGTAGNYIRLYEPSLPSSDTAFISAPGRTVSEVKLVTQYFDGLGRLVQTVNKGITPAGSDLVTPVTYDNLGRIQYSYLPYVPQSGNTSDGSFKTDPFNNQRTFYQSNTLNPGTSGESIYYNQAVFEPSPLNRTARTYAPGNSWAQTGGNRPVVHQYLLNTVADSVMNWSMSGGLLPVPSAAYAAGQLFKDVITDEAGKQSISYKDKEGHVILNKVQYANNPGTGHDGWLCTYYIYDYLGNLRVVVPPSAVQAIAGNPDLSPVAGELCFIYRYDAKHRLIVKKVPGADSTEMVYDLRDRLVFSRDGNMKVKNNWLVTFYDTLNRPIETALYNSNVPRATLQASMNTATSNTQSINYTFPGVADLVTASYDSSAQYQATNSITFESGFDTGAGGTTEALINTSLNQGTATITATIPLPAIPASALTPLTYTFYDNYNFTGVQPALITDFDKPQAGANPYVEPVTATSHMIKGMVTGTKVKVLNTPDRWLTSTVYYNDKGRVIQTISDNISGSLDVTTTLYDFNGKVLSTYLRHKNQRCGPTPQTTILTMMGYDAAGRLTSIKKRLNDTTTLERTIATNDYDELGRLKTKKLGINGTSAPIEQLSYEYNIRGWLRGINKSFVNTAGSTSNWFGQELNYDAGFVNNQYNGNITGIKWKSRSNSIARAYGYGYDNTNRLTAADFTQQNSGTTAWTRDQVDFTVSGLSYDANGNIRFMNQKGLNGATIQTIDSLKYGYIPNSNKLFFVTDRANNPQSALGDFKEINNNETQDYAYDGNGNLILDMNKLLAINRYNHLNLPDSITLLGKGYVEYTYDASGNKLRKKVTDVTGTGTITTTDYIDGFVYKNDTLQFAPQEEGRVRLIYKTGIAPAYAYDYFVKDHLGNVRQVLTEQTDFTMYTATMETASAATENALFSNLDNTRVPKPAGYPANQSASKNEAVAKLTAGNGGKKIGPSIVLRVMAGDTIQIGANAFYKSTGPQKNTGATLPAENMLAELLQAFNDHTVTADVHTLGTAGGQNPFNSNFYNNDYQRLKDKDPDPDKQDKPKAYLNFVLFDDQFKLVEENSGVKQVQATPDQLQTLAVDKMPIRKSGFLYVYTSNESTQPVFFDNIVLGAASGPLLEETHYYPFGLTMAGISSNALKGANYAENKYKYNKGSELQSKEFSDGTSLEMYATPLRSLDPQLGRWWQIDSKPDYAQSIYSAMSNNPILRNDPLGDSSVAPWSVKANQQPVNLLRPLGTNTESSGAKSETNQRSVATTNTNSNGADNKTAKGVSSTVKQAGEDGKPLIGSTTTNKVSKEASLSAGILGDKFTYAQSAGMVSGKDGSIVTTDLSSNKGAPDGASITLLGTFTLGVSTDISISAGIGVLGYEAHLSIGVGVGLGQIGAGASHTDGNNLVSGGDLTLRPGLGTLGAIFLAPKLVF